MKDDAISIKPKIQKEDIPLDKRGLRRTHSQTPLVEIFGKDWEKKFVLPMNEAPDYFEEGE